MTITRDAPVDEQAATSPLVTATNLTVHFRVRRGADLRYTTVHALDDVSITVGRGETVGVVGESGSGKTTLGRTLLRRVTPNSGRIEFGGVELSALDGEALRQFRRRMQSIFQDPYGSLNPRHRIFDAIVEPMIAHHIVRRKSEAKERVAQLLRQVGLPPDAMSRYPRAFSGGQLQRVAIARALAVEPEFIVADEPVSSLDVSIQAQVTNLMRDVQQRLGIAYLFISHDMAIVRQVSDRIVVMYAGKVVEEGACDEVLFSPVHPYTGALIAAIPSTGSASVGRRERISLSGEPADPTNPPSGCRFRQRCPLAQAICAEAEPPLIDRGSGHVAACWVR